MRFSFRHADVSQVRGEVWAVAVGALALAVDWDDTPCALSRPDTRQVLLPQELSDSW